VQDQTLGMRIHHSSSVREGGPAILFVSSPSALVAPSTGGSGMVALSLMKSFHRMGWRTGFLGFVKPERWPGDEEVVDRLEANGIAEEGTYWFGFRKDVPTNAAELERIVNFFEPKVIYCYGHEAAAMVNRLNGSFVTIVTLYDPLHFGSFYKLLNNLRSPSPRVLYRAARKLPAIYRAWKRHRLEELPALSKIDVVIVHSFNHSVFYQRQLHRPVSYFPNPLEPTQPLERGNWHIPPAFIMAGALHSSVSMTGLEFFLHKVLPHLRRDLESDKFQIRIMGGGHLRPDLDALRHIKNIKFLGHVAHEMLMEEYRGAVALLVPTPIRLGFRTRIMDAFRFRVPVIAHPANQAGFRELIHGQNCLMTSDGHAFAELMCKTITDQGLCARIAARAYEEFIGSYSSDVFTEFVIHKSEEVACKQ
jgi:glycosyltransferase involved in cell wall biosynthesis